MGDGDGDVELVRIVAPVARARRAYAEAVAVSLLKISPQGAVTAGDLERGRNGGRTSPRKQMMPNSTAPRSRRFISHK